MQYLFFVSCVFFQVYYPDFQPYQPLTSLKVNVNVLLILIEFFTNKAECEYWLTGATESLVEFSEQNLPELLPDRSEQSNAIVFVL